jgi:hypothetical protein
VRLSTSTMSTPKRRLRALPPPRIRRRGLSAGSRTRPHRRVGGRDPRILHRLQLSQVTIILGRRQFCFGQPGTPLKEFT